MLAGQPRAADAEAAGPRADLAAVIRRLDPGYKVGAIAAKRPRSPAADASTDAG